MKLKNCKICGKATPYITRGLCQNCYEQREQDYLRVRDFIKDNPKVAIEVVVEATGVDERQIREFMRDGAIQAADLNGHPLKCQKCGKPIAQGVLCPLCRQELSSGLGPSKEQLEGREKKNKERKPNSLVLQLRKRK
jgi:predicted amidophosphoribosyltransferase